MPPEVVRARSGRELRKSDMWSIGVIAFILVVGYVHIYALMTTCSVIEQHSVSLSLSICIVKEASVRRKDTA